MAANNYKNPPADSSANRPTGPAAGGPPRRNEPRPAPPPEAAPAPARANGPAPRPAAAKAATRPATNQPAAPRPAAPARPARPPRPLPGVGALLGLLRDRRLHLFVGFLLLLASLYLTIAFTSYLFSGHADQSVVESLGSVPVKEAGHESGNRLGLLGAWLAELFIYRGVGVAAFLLVPIVFFLGYKIVFRRAAGSVSYVLALGLFSMVWLSLLLGYAVVSLQDPGADPALAHRLDFLSGSIGYEAAAWLTALIGWGTVLLLAFLLISFVVFFFNVTSLNLSLGGLRGEGGVGEEPAAAPPATVAAAGGRPRADATLSDQAAVAEPDADEDDADFSAPPAPAGLRIQLSDASLVDASPAAGEVEILRTGPAGPLAAAGGVGLAASTAVPLVVATASATVATATVAASGAAGPSFSVELPAPEAEFSAAAPAARPAASIPTPLSLADLADADLPSAKPQALSTNLEITVPGRADLDPSAGAAIAAVADEDESADAMPDVNYDPTLDLARYQFPGLDLLNDYGVAKAQVTKEELEANKDRIVETLGHYGITIASIKATIGPTVTLYEIVPDAGIRISKIKSLEDDIALSLAALGIRIIAPIPGKGTIGIEVPNAKKEMVSIRSVLGSEKFARSEMDLPVAFGRTITNEVFVADLAKMPHLLMAGATGQGKSVGLNVILASLLYKRHPAQLKFVLVDPKKVELSIFNKIERHYLAKLPDTEEAIITDTKKVVNTLNSLCMEMDRRYDLLKEAGCRNLKEYNHKFVERRLNPKKGHRFLPFIVLVIDELADLMMTAGKEVETPIARLAQLARAIGIHLIVATQRPSVNVITGIIKANFPCRISFKVTSKIDSRTILDTGGADQLIGQGDMLFSAGSDLIRVQCAFIDTPEVDRLCDFIGEQPGYADAYLLPEVAGADGDAGSGNEELDPSERDSMFEEAARCIVLHQQGSTSLIQRKLKLGYNRAGRLIDQLQHAGIVGPFEGSKAREVLIPDEYQLEQLLSTLPK
ncbi:DNA translocase FtsK 4TM domain-containing protein [uncultured Hymenobacter sp.]|uniref:FtsK/SpoIIIE family DNA translocase n=1 Tax=uncultured Hymenobacter sp. TaxID=170016 RepID=UPI0035CAF5B4